MNKKQNRRRNAFKNVLAAITLFVLAAAICFFCTVNQTAIAQTTSVTAKSADSFVDSVGVNVHLHYPDTPYYYNFDNVIKPRLIESGIRHLRDGLVTYPGANGDIYFYQRVRALAEYGIKFNLITAMPTNWSQGTNYDLLDDAYTWSNGAIASFEGINEPNIQGVHDWVNVTRSEQQKLWNAVQNNSTLQANVKVLGPSPIFFTSYDLGNISHMLDYGNAHPYPGGFCPTCPNVYGQSIDTFMDQYTYSSGTKPITVTETGYHNAVNTPGHGHRPASELAAGKYISRLFFEYFNRGIVRTFSYELIDQYSDPSRANVEHNFGLLRHDGTEKPAFTALKNVLSLLRDPGPAFTTNSLNYTLSGNTSDVHQTLLQKRDGTFYLALWVEKDSYETGMRPNEPQVPDLEPNRRHDYAVSTRSVTLTFETSISQATVYSLDDAGNMSGTAASISGNSINLNVPDKVTVVELTLDTGGGGGLVSGALYEFEPQCAPGKRLDVARFGGNGALLQLWADASGSNQRFQAIAVGDGVFELVPQHNISKRLDVSGGAISNGTPIIIYDDLDAANQRWRAFDVGNGLYEIEPTHAAGKRLDVTNAGSTNGTTVQLWTDNNSAAQRWRLLRQ